MSHTLKADFAMDYVRSWSIVGAQKVGSAFETPRREISEDVSFGIGIPLDCRAIGIGKPPQGFVIHTVRRTCIC